MARDVRVGTASWTDPEFIKAGWYPADVKGDAEGRLRYYAERFPMVEVNASFYALPTVGDHRGLGGADPAGLPLPRQGPSGDLGAPLRAGPPAAPAARRCPSSPTRRGRIRKPSRELRDAVIDSLLEAVGPLGDKLGAILLQLPPYVVSGPTPSARRSRASSPGCAPRAPRSSSATAPGPSPASGEAAAEMLGEHDAAWVVVDAPRIDAKNVMPPIVEVTTPALAYLRLHGRNAATWNTGRTVAERFDHVYSDEEMEEWIDPVLDMAERAQEVAVVFNNNARDYALRNATRFGELLNR